MDEDEGPELRLQLKINRRNCPHCNVFLSLKSYKVHRRLYYDEIVKQWHTQKAVASDSEGLSPPHQLLEDLEEAEEIISCATPPALESDALTTDEEVVDIPTPAEIWDDNENIIDDFELELPCSSDLHPQDISSEASSLVNWITSFFSFLQGVYKLSDKVISLLISFFHILFGILGRFSPVCKDISNLLPKSLYAMLKFTGSAAVKHKCYVVCRKCHQIYHFRDCLVLSFGSKRCTYQAFPYHPQHIMRQPCNTLLLKTVELASGKSIAYPFMTYCYLSIVSSMERFLQQPTFYSLCNEWRKREVPEDLMCDVFDGRMWKEFERNGSLFFSDTFSFGFMINVDWFQPYKHTQYSVGVVFLTVLNLPRHLRNKRNNVMLIGIIPGPHEPSKNINSFLEPLVEELLCLWSGKYMKIHGFSRPQLIKGALLCAACDLPAGRKLCGFLSFNAKHGCSRCWKEFSGGVGNLDFSGFDRDKWKLRSLEEHREVSDRLLVCKTKNEKSKLESDTGYRYTSLLKLPYFSPTRMLIIDPMHNLFWGTAKHFLKSIWIGQALICTRDFDIIQSRIDKVSVPADIGRIPYKIRSGFSSFTADQFKNWVLYFSLLTLRDKLLGEHWQCWLHYVLACRILTSKSITTDKTKVADALLLQFCRRSERMYGKNIVTPNMHCHVHLRACILDYGPLHGFWLFSFERFNGLLGDQPNNNRSVEIQLMSRFIRDNYHMCMPLPNEFEEFKDIFSKGRQVVGTVSESLDVNLSFSLPPLVVESLRNWSVDSLDSICLPPRYLRGVLNTEEKRGLILLYSRLYSVPVASVCVNSSFLKYKRISLHGKHIGSLMEGSKSSSLVMAQWHQSFSSNSNSMEIEERPTQVNYFMKHIITISNHSVTVLLFSASWFKHHQKNKHFGRPLSVWECDLFDEPEVSHLIPVQFIRRRTVSLVDIFDDNLGSALFVIPCVDF